MMRTACLGGRVVGSQRQSTRLTGQRYESTKEIASQRNDNRARSQRGKNANGKFSQHDAAKQRAENDGGATALGYDGRGLTSPESDVSQGPIQRHKSSRASTQRRTITTAAA